MESTTVDQEQEPGTATAASRVSETRPLPPPKKKSSKKFAILSVFLILAGIGVYLWVHSLNRESTDDAQVDGHIIPVSPKIYGKVQEVLVDDNQQVKKGQVLVRIDPSDFQAKVDQAQAALAVAESQSQGASAGVPLIRD